MSLESARKVLLQEAAALVRLSEKLDERFETAIDWILASPGRVITCGVGKSGHIARKTAGTLSSTGTPSLFLHAAEAVHGDLGIVAANDIVIMYSHSGETDELVRLFPSMASLGAKTILITGRDDSSCSRLADLVLLTHVDEEACPNNLAPTTSTTAMLALSDALAMAVMERRAFTREDYAKLHPAGTLGKRLLLRVRDVMRTGPDLAEVSPATPILDVMRAITAAGAGAACVLSGEKHFLGLITEGDIRRHLVNSPEPFSATAEQIMIRNAWTIEPDLLAVEALEVFENLPKPVGDMPVLHDGKVIGLVMLKDLLRTGIV